MRLRTAGFLILMTMAAGVRPAHAKGFITPFLGYNFGGDSANCLTLTNCQDKRTNYGVSIGSSLSGLGLEEDISYAKDFFGSIPGSDNSVFSAMTNLLVTVPAGPFRPYFAAGLGLIKPHVAGPGSLLSVDKNSFGYDFGGGMHIMMHRIGVRGDLRYFKTLQDIPLFTNQTLGYWRGSVGLTLEF